MNSRRRPGCGVWGGKRQAASGKRQAASGERQAASGKRQAASGKRDIEMCCKSCPSPVQSALLQAAALTGPTDFETPLFRVSVYMVPCEGVHACTRAPFLMGQQASKQQRRLEAATPSREKRRLLPALNQRSGSCWTGRPGAVARATTWAASRQSCSMAAGRKASKKENRNNR